jgi:hypothetical protein
MFGEINTGPGGSTTTTGVNGVISTTTASLSPAVGNCITTLVLSVGAGLTISVPVGTAIVSNAGSVTYFLNTQCGFAGGTMNVGGVITAVRIS